MKILRRGWHAVYAILCLCVCTTSAGSVYHRKIHDLDSTSRGYIGLPKDRLTGNDFGRVERKLIPIKSPTFGNDVSLPTVSLEPDAEMLPAHYTGVKPPGVDHMELKRAESKIFESKVTGSEGNVDQGGRYASWEDAGEEGGKKVASFARGSEGDEGKEKHRKEYSEAGGKQRTHSEEANEAKETADEAGGGGGAAYANAESHDKGSNAAGYRSVYHKDEYKKAADFYDNDQEGGKYKKHDRYDERHTAHEGAYKKGASHGAGFDQAEHGKKGILENARVDKEAKGHDARHGYDRFFKNYQGFGNEGTKTEGRKYGYSKGKVH